MMSGQIQGREMTVVLLHAFPLSSDMWLGNRTSLDKSFRLITPDLSGFGKSRGKSAHSIEEMAQDVFFLLEELKIKEPIFLAGLSMGGYVALEFYRKYPERVKGLGLFSTRAGSDTPEIREKRFQGIEKIEKEGLESFLEGNLPKLLGRTTLENHPEMLARLQMIASENSPEGISNALLAIAERRDSTDLLKNIKCPVLVMGGREDLVIPISEAEVLAAQIPNSVLHRFETAGHLLSLEASDEFESVFKNFIHVNFKNKKDGHEKK